MAKILICGDFKASDISNVRISERLKEAFAGAQLCICNFEVPIQGFGKPVKKSGPVHCQDAKAPVFLKQAGFNLFLTANNHIMDYGKEGCEATLNALGRDNTVGSGNAKDAYALKIRVVDKSLVGVLSFVQNEFGVVEHPADVNGYGAAWVLSAVIEDLIKDARSKVDYLIVCPHAGVENIEAPLPEWRNVYRSFIDWGADMVAASHPHVPQGWEVYKDRMILYSLGNFYFDKFDGKKYFNTSLMVEVDFGETISVTPHIINFENGFIDYSQDKADEKHLAKCNALLSNQIEYYRYIDKICDKIYSGNVYGILRGVCGLSFRVKPRLFFRLLAGMLLNKSDEMYLLNAFRCESHRWVIQRALQNKNR